jgi:hypothetical protein
MCTDFMIVMQFGLLGNTPRMSLSVLMLDNIKNTGLRIGTTDFPTIENDATAIFQPCTC